MSTVSKLSKNLEKFRLVTFDVTDTLLKFRMPISIQYANTAAQYGCQIDQNKLNETFRNEFIALDKKFPNFGKYEADMKWQTWWRMLVINTFEKADSNIEKDKLNLIANALITTYKSEESWSQIDGGPELITKIKNSLKIIGIISNFDPSLRELIKTMKLPKFDFVLTSYESGLLKPDKKIFEAACNSYGLNPTESLHIGNKYDKDYLGAINAGWSSFLISDKYTSNEKLKEMNINPNHVYKSLKQLLWHLETNDIIF